MRLARSSHAGPAILAVATALLVAIATPAAQAASFGCQASAARGTVLGGALVEPVVANRGAAECRTASGGLSAPLPAPLSAGAVVATTTFGGPDGGQTALAAGGLADLRVLSLPTLPITLPTAGIPDALGSVAVPITGLLQTLLGGTASITLDLRPALQALLPAGQLPTAELLRVQGALAGAEATCRDGVPSLSGSSSVIGVTVAGLPVPAGAPIDRTLALVDTSSIDPSDVDLATIALPPGLSFTAPVTGPLLQTAVRAVLDGLPAIAVPGTLARVKVTPGAQARSLGGLHQSGPRVEVSIAGQSVADLVVGDALVGVSGACDEPTVEADAPAIDPGELEASDLVLGCTKRRLVLTDVQERGGRVRLLGVADRSLAGRRVRIRFTHTGRTVARATVRPEGGFSASARLPAKRLRRTNKARYQAVIGRERSLSLKLHRRMVLRAARASRGRVTLSGRVVRPLGRPVRTITVRRRISCKRSETVGRVRPRRDGTFRITVDAPEDALATVYRLSTRVRKSTRNRKTFPTFTLPRAISLT